MSSGATSTTSTSSIRRSSSGPRVPSSRRPPGRAVRPRVGVEHPARCLGLEHDDGERVRDEVVQLASDPGPFSATAARAASSCSRARASARAPSSTISRRRWAIHRPSPQVPARMNQPGSTSSTGSPSWRRGTSTASTAAARTASPTPVATGPAYRPERVDDEQHREPLGAAARRPERRRPRTRPARRGGRRAASRRGEEHRECVNERDQGVERAPADVVAPPGRSRPRPGRRPRARGP